MNTTQNWNFKDHLEEIPDIQRMLVERRLLFTALLRVLGAHHIAHPVHTDEEREKVLVEARKLLEYVWNRGYQEELPEWCVKALKVKAEDGELIR